MTNADLPPRILISRAEEVIGEIWDDYAGCVQRAGGAPEAADLAFEGGIATLGEFDGLLLTAGVDVDPVRYGEPRSDRVREVNAERDAFEEALIAAAAERDVPILAICRGHQVLNVAHGGGLLQHLDEREPHRARYAEDRETIASGWHEVEIAPGSLLASITGATTIRVNSRHHQAVTSSTVADDLTVSGTAEQEVVEAIEDRSLSWCLGIQWHPERPEMWEDPSMQNASTAIFEAFVEACEARRDR